MRKSAYQQMRELKARGQSIVNRWGNPLYVGDLVRVRDRENKWHGPYKILHFDKSSKYAKAYGVSAKLDSGALVSVDDVAVNATLNIRENPGNRSATSTRTEVRSPTRTSTSTKARTRLLRSSRI